MKKTTLIVLLISSFISCGESKEEAIVQNHLNSVHGNAVAKIKNLDKVRSVYGKDSLYNYKNYNELDKKININDSLVMVYQDLIIENIKGGLKEKNPELKSIRNKYIVKVERLKLIKSKKEYYTNMRDSLLFDVYDVDYKIGGLDMKTELHLKGNKVIK